MTVFGAVLITLGVLLTLRYPRLTLNLKRGKLYGIAGPVLIILGVLMVIGIISG